MRAVLMLLAVIAIAIPAAAQQSAPAKPSAAKAAKPAAASSGKPAATPTAPVNLNTATQEQLESLPGVGAKAAERILEYRQKNGNFKKIEDLMNVQGIGEKSFLKLKPQVVVKALDRRAKALKLPSSAADLIALNEDSVNPLQTLLLADDEFAGLVQKLEEDLGGI